MNCVVAASSSGGVRRGDVRRGDWRRGGVRRGGVRHGDGRCGDGRRGGERGGERKSKILIEDAGAPVAPMLIRKALWTTLVSALLFLALDAYMFWAG